MASPRNLQPKENMLVMARLEPILEELRAIHYGIELKISTHEAKIEVIGNELKRFHLVGKLVWFTFLLMRALDIHFAAPESPI